MASACSSLVLVILAAVALAGCTGDIVEPLDPDGPWESLDQRPCPDESTLSWETFGDPFVRNWCTGCHSSQLEADDRRMAPLRINFDDLEGIREHAPVVWLMAADGNEEMPPAGGPGPAERALLGEWLACGTPTEADLD